MSNNNNNPLREAVLEAIKKGKVHMRPRWHFVLRAWLFAVGCLLVFLTALYLTSLVIFALQQTGNWFAPDFGSRGWRHLFFVFPWVLTVLALACILVLELLVRYYTFAYRRPILLSLVLVLVIALGGGHVVARTSFHQRISSFSVRHRVPFAADYYRHFGMPRMRPIHLGMASGTLTLVEPNEEEFVVSYGLETRRRPGMVLTLGDTVVVFGDQASGTVRAFEIREVPAGFNFPMSRQRMAR